MADCLVNFNEYVSDVTLVTLLLNKEIILDNGKQILNSNLREQSAIRWRGKGQI
jgi:hypothetical protein